MSVTASFLSYISMIISYMKIIFIECTILSTPTNNNLMLTDKSYCGETLPCISLYISIIATHNVAYRVIAMWLKNKVGSSRPHFDHTEWSASHFSQ